MPPQTAMEQRCLLKLANDKEGKSAINLSNLGIFAKFGPGPFIYVRLVGGAENYLC